MDTKKRISWKPLFTVISAALFTVFVTQVITLGLLRFHTLRLTGELNNLERDIKHYSTEEAELRQTLSKLASPIAIYAHCKEKLGMDKALQVDMIRVPSYRMAAAQPERPAQSWRSNLFSFLGLNAN